MTRSKSNTWIQSALLIMFVEFSVAANYKRLPSQDSSASSMQGPSAKAPSAESARPGPHSPRGRTKQRIERLIPDEECKVPDRSTWPFSRSPSPADRGACSICLEDVRNIRICATKECKCTFCDECLQRTLGQDNVRKGCIQCGKDLSQNKNINYKLKGKWKKMLLEKLGKNHPKCVKITENEKQLQEDMLAKENRRMRIVKGATVTVRDNRSLLENKNYLAMVIEVEENEAPKDNRALVHYLADKWKSPKWNEWIEFSSDRIQVVERGFELDPPNIAEATSYLEKHMSHQRKIWEQELQGQHDPEEEWLKQAIAASLMTSR